MPGRALAVGRESAVRSVRSRYAGFGAQLKCLDSDRYEWSNACVECDDSGIAGAIIVFIIATWFFVLFLLRQASRPRRNNLLGIFFYFSQARPFVNHTAL